MVERPAAGASPRPVAGNRAISARVGSHQLQRGDLGPRHHHHLAIKTFKVGGRKGDNFERYAKTNAGVCFRVPFEVVALTTPHLESLDCQVVATGPQNPLHVVLAASLLSNSGPSGVSFVSHALVLLARATKA